METRSYQTTSLELRGAVEKMQPPADLTDDVFLGGLLTLRQPVRGYRAGLDAVLLASIVPPDAKGRVLDVGAGIGTVGLSVAARCSSVEIVMVERQAALAELAAHNVLANGLEGRAHAVAVDIAKVPADLASGALRAESFAMVLANPPYHELGSCTSAPEISKAQSHAMAADERDAWVRFLSRMTSPGGRAVMIQRAECLPALLATFDGRFGAIHVLPIHAREGDAANRVIVGGTKGSRAPIKILPGLVLHEAGQAFRPNVERIFRNGAHLPFFT